MTRKAITDLDLAGLSKYKSGKVREVFDLGTDFLFVATDRISAFDCILPNGIPDKGRVLSTLSAWWFERTRHVVPNHLVTTDVCSHADVLKPYGDLLRGRSMLVRKAKLLPVECIARGYLIGSGWKEYQASGTIGGMPLRAGYGMADQLDEPIFTPSSKAESGHDENISYEQVAEMVGAELAERLRDTTLQLYGEAAEYARERGIIIADTKFEFGLIDGELTLVDEALTPDSSRFWPAEQYRPGISPPSYDKQYVRDYLETLDWDKTPPAPQLPEDVVARTREKYLEAFRQLTGSDLPD